MLIKTAKQTAEVVAYVDTKRNNALQTIYAVTYCYDIYFFSFYSGSIDRIENIKEKIKYIDLKDCLSNSYDYQTYYLLKEELDVYHELLNKLLYIDFNCDKLYNNIIKQYGGGYVLSVILSSWYRKRRISKILEE